MGIGENGAETTAVLVGIALVALVAYLANLVAKRILLRIADALISKSRVNWLMILRENRVFARLAQVAPALVISFMLPQVLEEEPPWGSFLNAVEVGVKLYLIVIAVVVVDAILNSLVAGYERLAKGRLPIKGPIQALKLVTYIIGVILCISVLIDQPVGGMLTGLGALTAVLMLVFRDPIMGLVAGVQLSANNMVKKGDWIEMSHQNADGEVIDVSLTTVKVQNWDRTITSVPSYSLISESFKNWRGMQESGGRRMMRSIFLDVRSIRFLDEPLLERLRKIRLLEPYLEEKLSEILKDNRERKIDTEDLINGRHLTNIGSFRAYCAAYLKNHSRVHQEMIQLVRQLDPTPHGVPLQIYGFTNDTAWVNYEGIQSDIFDHLFSIIPYFDLRVFQQPSGTDLEDLSRLLRPAPSDPPESCDAPAPEKQPPADGNAESKT